VFSIEYDPNRSCYIALILYSNGFLSYILATEHLKLGDVVTLGDSMDFSEGDRMPAILFEIGTKVNNVSY
jgi:large subunit ribosomal protein L2